MIRSRWLPITLALIGLLCANLRAQYRVCVNGAELPGSYSAAVLRRCERAAAAAADEILREEAVPPAAERRLRLSFRRPENDAQALTDALLRATPGLTCADAVCVNGLRLGTVADGQALCSRLRETILEQMPVTAVSGNISGQLSLRRVYTRAETLDTPDELLPQITGMAPVIYLDGSGRLA